MNRIDFERILLKTAFCCMASDAKIAKEEISTIKLLSQKLIELNKVNIESEIMIIVQELNNKGTKFIKDHLEHLSQLALDENEKIEVIDFAIEVIKSDNELDYSEIKLLKNIKARLKIDDKVITDKYPEFEMFFENDIDLEENDLFSFDFINTLNIPQIDFQEFNN